MHGRLKKRLLSYSFLFFIILLIGKLFHVKNECDNNLPNNDGNQHQHNHHAKRDAWNLNEHQIEANMVQEIERLKRSNKGKQILGMNQKMYKKLFLELWKLEKLCYVNYKDYLLFYLVW